MQRIEDYGAYCARRADELAAEQKEVAVDFELVELCRECRGTGYRETQFGRYWADFVTSPCPFCQGSGAAAIYPIGRDLLPPAA